MRLPETFQVVDDSFFLFFTLHSIEPNRAAKGRTHRPAEN
jgi:hypothetical protein